MNAPTELFVGRYRLLRVLGKGAMGVVYEAVDTRLDRTVAIKTVLRSHLDDESTAADYAARFEREARAAARLSHPHIVAVHDFGDHDNASYIVMEFVRGRELAQRFASGEPLSLAEGARIIGELLQALHYAHEQGVVHRDVKPANVMLDSAGRVKLADFGVARVASGNNERTLPGTVVGTPSYMAPEQLLGLAVGSRADIYAVGVILYQLLTGRRPHDGHAGFELQRRIVTEDALPPSHWNPALGKAWDGLALKALARQPEARFATAGAFGAELARVAAGVAAGVAARAATPPPAAPAPAAVVAKMKAAAAFERAPAKRWPWVTGAGGLVVLAGAVALWGTGPSRAPQPAVTPVPTPASAPLAASASAPAAVPAPVSPAASAPPAASAAAQAEPPAAAAVAAAPAPAPKPAAAPASRPAKPAAPAEDRGSTTARRCADLLLRMQIGEPLSAEQDAFFQSRCSR